MREAGGIRALLANPRSWVLVAVAAFSLGYHVFYSYDVLTQAQGAKDLGFEAGPMKGRLAVLSVTEKDGAGNPTPAYIAGLQQGDRIVARREPGGALRPIRGLFDEAEVLRGWKPRRSLVLEVERGEGPSPQGVEVVLSAREPAPARSLLPLIGLLPRLLLPLFCIAMGLLVGFSRLQDSKAFLASLLLFCFGGAAWGGGYPNFPPAARLAGLVLFTALFSWWSYLFMRFFLVFPSPGPIDRRYPRLKDGLLAFPLVFTLWNINWGYTEGVSFDRFAGLMSAAGAVDKALDILFLLLFAAGYVSLALNRRSTESRPDRRRLELLLVGSLGALPALVFYFYKAVMWGPPLPGWVYYATGAGLGLFPVLFAYAVVKHRVFGIRLILRRGLQFALLSKGFLAVEGVLVFLGIFYAGGPLLARLLDGADSGTIALATALATMGVVLALRRINRKVMRLIESRFFREAYDARFILMDLSRAVRQLATEPFDLLRLVTSKLMDSLHPDQVVVFIRGEDAARFPRPLIESDAAARSLSAGRPEDYVCLCHRVSQGPLAAVPAPLSSRPVLCGSSPLVGKLADLFSDEPGTLLLAPEDSAVLAGWTHWEPPALRDPTRETRRAAKPLPRLLVPLVANRRLLGFVVLWEKQSEEPYSREDKELLLSLAQQVALALDYGGFLKEEADELNLRHELDIAKGVQERLFPQVLPEVPGLDYTGACQPARGVGGDYYDFVDLGEGRLGVALGDVTGKGISAALLMASLQAMLRIHSEAHREDPDRLTSDINRHMCRGMDANRFASFFYGVFDPRARLLTYVNAGHNPPMIFRPSGRPLTSLGALAAPPVQEGERCEVLRLMPTGMVLGVLEDAAYRRTSVQLQPGDVLVVFTDGVTEAMDAARVEYGEEALQELVSGCLSLPASEIRDRITEDVQRFVGEAGQADDITLIVAKVLQ
jgi:phosphoserine phosphatase RsbU/P